MANIPSPRSSFVSSLVNKTPDAVAFIHGNSDYPDIYGVAKFYDTPYNGVIIESELIGLPRNIPSSYFGFHIHEYGTCQDGQIKAGPHYNPEKLMHPMHAGDLPPILSNNGFAWFAIYDERINIKQIKGRPVILHRSPDDFTSQPSGNSGEMIACGIIETKYK